MSEGNPSGSVAGRKAARRLPSYVFVLVAAVLVAFIVVTLQKAEGHRTLLGGASPAAQAPGSPPAR